MRERYAAHLRSGVILGCCLIAAGALVTGLSLLGTLSWFFAALPILRWGVREIQKQSDAVNDSAKVVDEARKTWDRLLATGAIPADASRDGRNLQDLIFAQRKRDQPVFSWVYHRYRDDDEEAMRVGVEALAAEYAMHTLNKQH